MRVLFGQRQRVFENPRVPVLDTCGKKYVIFEVGMSQGRMTHDGRGAHVEDSLEARPPPQLVSGVQIQIRTTLNVNCCIVLIYLLLQSC